MTKQAGMPRGIRNNNPGNIEATGIQWDGMASAQSDGRFVQFSSPDYGIRALAILLRNYQDRHGLNTVSGIIGRYAPTWENNTSAYMQDVAAALRVSPFAPINVHSPDVMRALVTAIIRHENGMQPYNVATIDNGLRLAGVSV